MSCHVGICRPCGLSSAGPVISLVEVVTKSTSSASSTSSDERCSPQSEIASDVRNDLLGGSMLKLKVQKHRRRYGVVV